MTVTLLGAGCGQGCLESRGRAAVTAADLVVGAPRVLRQMGKIPGKKLELYQKEEILNAILTSGSDRVCVVFSGDSGFYSGCGTLVPLLEKNKIEYKVLPGISSVQVLSARLGRSWQDWKLCSAHGTEADVAHEVMSGKPCFFLTGGKETPQSLCKQLTEAGIGQLKVVVGENLGEMDETILTGKAVDFAKREFAPLSVLLTEAAPVYEGTVTGIEDEEFIRTSVPMTKREVRSFIPSALQLKREDVCWDIGAGTGSVSVELALRCKGVWAVEREKDALDLIEKNKEKFCAWNLRIVEAEAPDALEELPAPDGVFIGGSGGHLEKILDAALRKNEKVRICISAITMETLALAVPALERRGMKAEVVQLTAARTKGAGEYHLLIGQNPTFLIYGQKE